MLKLGVVLSAGLVAMGGWAVVTVKDLPEYFVAGRQYTLEFQVRQHGRTLLSGLHPRLVVGTGKDETTIPAVAKAAEGTYAVTFTAPSSNQVSLTIQSGFGNNALRLYPAPVIAAGASRGAMNARERGQVLFVSKGCTTCHTNTDLADAPSNDHVTVGPELGGRRLARDYVIQKVKRPASQIMPDLGLSDAEVSAIAAFLSAERGTTTGR
jgi:mono/diheme cytochrome c family protein